jgi:hypothetical protein
VQDTSLRPPASGDSIDGQPVHWQLATNIAAPTQVNLKLPVHAKAQRVLLVDTKQRVLLVKAKNVIEIEILFFLDSMVGSSCDIIANAASSLPPFGLLS